MLSLPQERGRAGATGLGREVGSVPTAAPSHGDAALCPAGGSGQPLITLSHPQRFQKATQPLDSWRTAAARDVARDVMYMSAIITAPPHGSSED